MANLEATNLKAGITFLMDGNPYRVVKYTHTKIARGGGSVKLSVRNLKTGKLEDKSLNSSAKVDDINTTKRLLQYLYSDGTSVTFMDPKSYEQVEISAKTIGDELSYIKDGQEVDVLFWDNQPLSVDIPPKVTLVIEDTAPGVKGDTASNVYKPATLENGLRLKVPLFIKVGEKIRVDTRSGEYIGRAK